MTFDISRLAIEMEQLFPDVFFHEPAGSMKTGCSGWKNNYNTGDMKYNGVIESKLRIMEQKLQDIGIISVRPEYENMVRFRNFIVHRYEKIDLEIIYGILNNKVRVWVWQQPATSNCIPAKTFLNENPPPTFRLTDN